MHAFTTLLFALSFGLIGCASTPTPRPAQVEAWPASVAKKCPQRKTSLCCFRKQATRAAMRALVDKFKACYRQGAKPVHVVLNIETKGGKASCVEHKQPHHETARCLATTVANHFSIESPPHEHCQIAYPLSFRYAGQSRD